MEFQILIKKTHTYLLGLLGVVITMASCQKAVTIDLPDVEQDYVVEGKIETGIPPIVIISETQGYFDEASAASIFGAFVHGADVQMTTNGNTFQLTELCTSSLPDSLLPEVSQLTGIPVESLAYFDYCVYTSLDPSATGQVGRHYKLNIDINGEALSANTSVPYPVALDSLWFDPVESLDSLGFIGAILSDPDTVGNIYRWYAQRINQYTYGELEGEVKDPFPITPLGSIFDDKFINGLTFDFGYQRGEVGALEGPDDEGIEEGYFKSGDTVVVKFTATTRDNFLYIRALENQAGTAGSPFASAGNLPFNIQGGIGIWAGYAPIYDTVICP